MCRSRSHLVGDGRHASRVTWPETVADLYWAYYLSLPDTPTEDLELDPTTEAILGWMQTGNPAFVDLLVLLLARAPRDEGGWLSYWELSTLRTFWQASGEEGREALARAATSHPELSASLDYLRTRGDLHDL